MARRGGAKKAVRKRVYNLVGLLFMVILCLIGLLMVLHVTQVRIDEELYTEPHKVLNEVFAPIQSRFRRHDRDEDGAQDYATSLAELEEAGMITRRLAEGGVRGYRYEVIRADAQGYAIVATPAAVTTASLFYYMDQTRIVRAATGEPAGADSEVYYDPRHGKLWRGEEPE